MNFFKKQDPVVQDVEAGPKPAITGSILERIGSKANSLVETAENYQTGLIIIGTGFVFLMLATIFLPFFVISPYKFCAFYSMGTITIFAGILVIKGKELAVSLMSKRYVLFTLMFVLSFLGEFYFAIFDKRYLMVLVFLALHTLSCVYLLFAAVPGGVKLLNSMVQMGFGLVKKVLGRE